MRKELDDIAAALAERGHAAGALQVHAMAVDIFKAGHIPDTLGPGVEVVAYASTKIEEDDFRIEKMRREFEAYDLDRIDRHRDQYPRVVLTPRFAQEVRTRIKAGELPDHMNLSDVRLTGTDWTHGQKSGVNGPLHALLRNGIPTLGEFRDVPPNKLLGTRGFSSRSVVFMKHTFRKTP